MEKDPNSTGTEQQVIDQVATLLEIRDHINNVVGMINEIEWIAKATLRPRRNARRP